MPDLPRKLTTTDLAAIAIGNMIGAAVFLTPNIVATAIPSPSLILLAWTFAGLISLAGALSMAELGAMMPASGGQYVYLRESVGPFWGFLFGWTTFVAIRSGGLASLAIAFTTYLAYFFPLEPVAAKAIAALLLLGLAGINYVGVRTGATVQKVFTALKLLGLGAVIGAGLLYASPPPQNWAVDPSRFSLSQFGLAMVPCLWAYQGWFSVPMVAGEAKNPGRSIPMSLGLAVTVVMLAYVLANVSYLRVMTVEEVMATSRAAASALERTSGPSGGGFVAAAILVSIFGAMNAGVLAGPRVYFAQARDGLFPSRFASVHPIYETPAFSIWAQAIWAAILAVSGSYQQLITYAAFTSWLFYGLTVVGLLMLRRSRPDAERPYHVPGYPVTPLVFALVSFWFVANTLATSTGPAAMGLLLVAGGAPLYWWTRVRQKRSATP